MNKVLDVHEWSFIQVLSCNCWLGRMIFVFISSRYKNLLVEDRADSVLHRHFFLFSTHKFQIITSIRNISAFFWGVCFFFFVLVWQCWIKCRSVNLLVHVQKIDTSFSLLFYPNYNFFLNIFSAFLYAYFCQVT